MEISRQEPRTFYAAERHSGGQCHSINKQTNHGWISKCDEMFQHSDKNSHRVGGSGKRTLFPPELDDTLNWIILEERK